MITFKHFLYEKSCKTFSFEQLKDLEKFADRLLNKYGIDIEFTKHFHQRMSDERNKPCITIAELQKLFKKIAKEKAVQLHSLKDFQSAVILDLQKDLNIPVVIDYDSSTEEFDVHMKTIMRKKGFRSSDPKIVYESFDSDPVEWKKQTENHYWFEIDEHIYDVNFEAKYKDKPNQISVSFTLDLGPGTTKIMSLAKTGNQFLVLVTVIDIWKDYVKSHPEIDTYIFTAINENSNKSRSKVYERLIKRHLPSGWKHKRENVISVKNYSLDRFIITKSK